MPDLCQSHLRRSPPGLGCLDHQIGGFTTATREVDLVVELVVDDGDLLAIRDRFNVCARSVEHFFYLKIGIRQVLQELLGENPIPPVPSWATEPALVA